MKNISQRLIVDFRVIAAYLFLQENSQIFCTEIQGGILQQLQAKQKKTPIHEVKPSKPCNFPQFHQGKWHALQTWNRTIFTEISCWKMLGNCHLSNGKLAENVCFAVNGDSYQPKATLLLRSQELYHHPTFVSERMCCFSH